MTRSRITIAASATALMLGTAHAAVLTDFSVGTIAPGTSSYFVSATMVEAGSYNLAVFDTIHPSWSDFFDHTVGTAAGKFMVVNGASGVGGGGLAWSASVPVTPGTDYEFGAWFASVYGFATATLKFVVIGDTTLTGPVFGAPDSTSTWEHTTYAFSSGAATSVTLQIWDVSGIGDGNDYAIDDITLSVVPTPGAAGVLALGGAVALRRRRR